MGPGPTSAQRRISEGRERLLLGHHFLWLLQKWFLEIPPNRLGSVCFRQRQAGRPRRAAHLSPSEYARVQLKAAGSLGAPPSPSRAGRPGPGASGQLAGHFKPSDLLNRTDETRRALGSWCAATPPLEPANMPGNCTALGNGTPPCPVPFEESRAYLVAVYSAVCALGLPANCLTAGLTLLQALQGSVLAVYLFCLALCELLYAGTLPLWVIYVRNGHRWDLGRWACRVTAYIFFCNLYVSILFLCCISCDRYVAVAYALESRGRRRRRTAVLVSASVFLLVGLAHYPVFTMQVHECTCFEVLPTDGTVANYFYSRFAVGFALPLTVIAFTNHRIFRGIKQSAGLGAAQKARVRRTVIAVVVIFLACFAPYHLVLLTKAAAFSYYRGEKGPVHALECRLYTASMVCLCLATVNSVADPIIYVLATDSSRQEVSRLCRRWQKRSTKSTWSKDSEEVQSPTLLINSCPFPRPVRLPGSQPGALE